MSNIDRPRRTVGGPPAAPSQGAPSAPRARFIPSALPEGGTSPDIPSMAGTAVLNLTPEQIARIRILLVAMRMGRAVANDVRSQIFGLLNGGQRRVVSGAWFILSVRA